MKNPYTVRVFLFVTIPGVGTDFGVPCSEPCSARETIQPSEGPQQRSRGASVDRDRLRPV